MARQRRGPAGLEIWLYGVHLATLTEPALYRYRLTYTPEALAEFGAGARVLSLSLPVSEEPAEDHGTDPGRRPVSAFLEGLLPEGNLRSQLAAALDVLAIDKRALLAQVGAECAGAVQFLQPGQPAREGEVRPLTDREVIRIVEDLPTYNLPAGTAPQASLAGIQDKVLLTRGADGAWGWPEGGAPSSHIIKPEPSGTQTLPHLIEAEHWAMSVATAAGMTAAETALATFGDRRALVVTRYDRLQDGTRIHQEDFCQALGLDPSAKYETTIEAEARGTRLRRLASLAAPRCLDPDRFRRDLLALVTFNVVIGNGDAHSKNYSILLGRRGEVSLAPLYDAAPVRFMAPRFKNTGQLVNGRSTIDWVSLDDLTAEGASWGMSARRARQTVEDVVRRTWDAAHDVDRPEQLPDLLDNLENLWRRRDWRTTAGGR